MGLEIRSFLTLVLLSNSFIAFGLVSGLGFRLRSSKSFHSARQKLPAYLISVFLFAVLGTVILYLFLNTFYWENKNSIPKNAILIIVIYSILATLNLAFSEIGYVLKSLRLIVITEFFIVVIQIVIFLTLVSVGEVSYFVAVMIAFSLSYAFSIFSIALSLIDEGIEWANLAESFKSLYDRLVFAGYLNFLTQNLVERAEKILLPLFYQTPLLAQLTTYTSLLSSIRFIPESKAKIELHRRQRKEDSSTSLFIYRRFFYIITITCLALTSNLLIFTLLGRDWLLDLPLILVITCSEVIVLNLKEILGIRMIARSRLGLALLLILMLYFLLLLPLLMSFFDYIFVAALTVFVLGATTAYLKRVPIDE